MLIRLHDNSGRAALLRRPDIWAAQQRGPTGIDQRSAWPCVGSFVNEPDKHRTNSVKVMRDIGIHGIQAGKVQAINSPSFDVDHAIPALSRAFDD